MYWMTPMVKVLKGMIIDIWMFNRWTINMTVLDFEGEAHVLKAGF